MSLRTELWYANKEGRNSMKKVRFPYVAVDFDGTLCEDEFPEIGAPKERCIDYVKSLAAEGSKIILYTCRENGTRKLLDEAVAFCREHAIPIFAVNENPENTYAAQFGLRPEEGRKLCADLYIDDKAINAKEMETFGLNQPKQPSADSKLPEGGRAADKRWCEVMRMAEECGFITMAAGGTAVLITNENQLKSYGIQEYARIQRMNGRCPKKIGMGGCVDTMTGNFYCNSQCELYR